MSAYHCLPLPKSLTQSPRCTTIREAKVFSIEPELERAIARVWSRGGPLGRMGPQNMINELWHESRHLSKLFIKSFHWIWHEPSLGRLFILIMNGVVNAHARTHGLSCRIFSRSSIDKVNIKIHCDNKTVILQSALGRVPSFEVTLGRLRLQNRTSKSSRCKICKKYEPLSWQQSTVGLGCLLSQLIIVMVPH